MLLLIAASAFLAVAYAGTLPEHVNIASSSSNQQKITAIQAVAVLVQSILDSSEGRPCEVDDYFLQPLHDNGIFFTQCFNGTRITSSCPSPATFSSETLKCENSPLSDGESPPTCGTEDTFTDVFLSDCNKYYECTNGVVTTKACPEKENFDPISLACRPKANLNCSESSRRLPRPTVASEPPCQTGENFSEVHPNSCHEYFKCLDEKLTVETCPIFSNFDPLTLKCKEKWLVDCSSPSQKDAPPLPKCDRGDNFKEVYPDHCGKYIDCTNGAESIKTCYFLQLFDPVTLMCRPRWTVNCQEPSRRTSKSTVAPPPPACGPNDKFVDVFLEDCHKFYSCEKGSVSIETCQPFKNFDPVTLGCKYLWTVDCAQASRRTTPWATTEVTSPSPKTTANPNSVSSNYPSFFIITLLLCLHNSRLYFQN